MMNDKQIKKLKDVYCMVLGASSIIMIMTGVGGLWALIWSVEPAAAFLGRMALTFFVLDVVMEFLYLIAVCISEDDWSDL